MFVCPCLFYVTLTLRLSGWVRSRPWCHGEGHSMQTSLEPASCASWTSPKHTENMEKIVLWLRLQHDFASWTVKLSVCSCFSDNSEEGWIFCGIGHNFHSKIILSRMHVATSKRASTILAFDVFDVGLSTGSYIHQLWFLQTIRNHYVALPAPISHSEK